MYEAIVTMVYPATPRLVPGTGSLLSRDRIEEDEPAHTKVRRIEFDTAEDMENWVIARSSVAEEWLVGKE